MGSNIKQWTPAAEGKITELSPTLKSLTPFIDQTTVISGMELKNAYSPGNHATANAAFLSAAKAKMTEGSDYYLATTVDQIAAKRIGQDTRLPSLELAMDLLTPVRQLRQRIRVRLSEQSLVVLAHHAASRGGASAHRIRALVRRRRHRRGPASRVAKERKHSRLGERKIWRGFRRSSGPSDRTKVSEYLDTVREVERRIQKAEQQTAESTLPDLDRPVGVPAAYARSCAS